MIELWCWRCKQVVPMLDDEDYSRVSKLYAECASKAKVALTKRALMPQAFDLDAKFQPVRDLYAALTGWEDMHHNAIMHHRVSLYGPACSECGKPLRTPRASFCAACGAKVT